MDETKVKSKKKKILISVIVSVVLAIVIAATVVMIVVLSRPFRLSKVKKVELGMTKIEVEEILGEANEADKTRWLYYENKFAKKMEKYNKASDDFLSDDFDEEEDFDDTFEDIEGSYSELDGITYKFIMVTFDSKGTVTEVFFDKNHKYDEDDKYATAEVKIEKELELKGIGDYIDVLTTTKYINDEATTNKVVASGSDIAYAATFTDGSYILTKTSGDMEIDAERNVVNMKWRDGVAQYSCEKPIRNNSMTIKDGVVTDVSISSDLKRLSIPDGVTSIGENAFSRCDSLTEIVIPDSVTSIGHNAFYNYGSLGFYYNGTIDGWAQIDCGSIYLTYSFDLYINNELVTEAKITTATKIGYTFAMCDSLISVVIGDSVTSIEYNAFSNCNNLTSVVIGDSVTSIGQDTFSGCNNLTSVVIGDSVKRINPRVFSGCTSLTNVYYKGTTSDWGNIFIDELQNENLTDATRYYYIENEADVPDDGGNYWRYVDGVPTAW